jgi:predicted phosphoribosyltransferase/predicted esterase
MRQSSRFTDRREAAELLADRLEPELSGYGALVLGVPRGAVPMARIIADRVGGELDIVLVHKFSSYRHPEFALGSVTEEGGVYLGPGADRLNVGEKQIEAAAHDEIRRLHEKRALLTPGRQPVEVAGRIVAIIDDGIATGATMIAAVRSVREKGAARVIVAAPVASDEAVRKLAAEGAEIVTLSVPDLFYAVSEFYDDFEQVDDEEVIKALVGSPREVVIERGGVQLKGLLTVPAGASALILFAHGSGSGRLSPRNKFVAAQLNRAGLATLLLDLLQDDEAEYQQFAFDTRGLAQRLEFALEWLRHGNRRLSHLTLGVFGASTGAAAAVHLAAKHPRLIRAIVSRGGRPDLAWEDLPNVSAPTLLIVGGDDEPVLSLNKEAFERLPGICAIEVVPGAGHLFEGQGELEKVAEYATKWFLRWLGPARKAQTELDGRQSPLLT